MSFGLREVNKVVQHRPWPLPQRSWIMTQTWHDLLFAHWPVPAGVLRELVPAELEPDAYDGTAWLGVICFRMTGIRLRGMPPVPLTSQLPEVNVRTYVRVGGKPGVLFLSLDTGNVAAILLGRAWFRLPYFAARTTMSQREQGVYFSSHRLPAPGVRPAHFAGNYHPCSDFLSPEPHSFEHWLTARYCYYSVNSAGGIYRCDIHHLPWQLQRAGATIRVNTMAVSQGLPQPTAEPHLLYSPYMRALIWSIRSTST